MPSTRYLLGVALVRQQKVLVAMFLMELEMMHQRLTNIKSVFLQNVQNLSGPDLVLSCSERGTISDSEVSHGLRLEI